MMKFSNKWEFQLFVLKPKGMSMNRGLVYVNSQGCADLINYNDSDLQKAQISLGSMLGGGVINTYLNPFLSWGRGGRCLTICNSSYNGVYRASYEQIS